MLEIRNISKKYKMGETVQNALDNVNLNLSENEFVAILGPSGSGKTTLLNIIGGLDRYDSGDMIINGISTKEYKDRDWDTYRNHTVGFVFQSYNLIPHQTVLANVELALTLSGVSRSERKRRAEKSLEEVGLKEHAHKRPNQLSGGQMQRVAIARALVNNPDIVLADEPTGALDTETSIQVMELLKAVAKDRLVVMVTHNPDLASRYATRIVRLSDGKITDDSCPATSDQKAPPKKGPSKNKKVKMSFLTSLSLSFNNLRTKKGRTLLTSFAGSIGIIGIALILALSTGVNSYISDIQKSTMTSYPVTISAKTFDLYGLMSQSAEMYEETTQQDEEKTGVYADLRDIVANKTMIASNNLAEFKKYLDNPESDIREYIGENGIRYSYDASFTVYSRSSDGTLINSGADTEEITGSSGIPGLDAMQESMSGTASAMPGTMTSSNNAKNFSELMPGPDGETVSDVTKDSYELLYGSWPENYDEVIIVVNKNNGISTSSLYQLGFITKDEYKKITDDIESNGETEDIVWNYEDICDHTFYMVPACDFYTQNENGTFSLLSENTYAEQLAANALPLKITGIVKPLPDSSNADISTYVAYTSKLTDYIIKYTNESVAVKAQESTPGINILTGMEFDASTEDEKISDAKEYISNLGVSDKAALYTMILYFSKEETADNTFSAIPADTAADEAQLSAAMDVWLKNDPDKDILLSIYDKYLSGSSYDENMKAFGKVSYDEPSSIDIYTDSFEAKDKVAACIETYNASASEDNRIVYTDYVKLMTSSLTTIIDVISYVLIAFMSVSLVVSSIMIGIITHISVMERTKEIGILRAIGASKRNISQVFNAETVIIGFCAGLLGLGVSALLTIPINAIIRNLAGNQTITAQIPVSAAFALLVLSVIITVIGGLIPSKKAAKKDPVIALRTE